MSPGEKTLSSRVHLRFAAAACAVLAVLVLGSCEFPGFLGDSFTIDIPVYEDTGTLFPWDYENADATLSMMDSTATSTALFPAIINDGNLIADITAPDSSKLKAWDVIIPLTPAISDSSALGCVINTIAVEGFPGSISYRNLEKTTYVFWTYSNKDVNVTASGDYQGPGNVGATMSMDIDLKKGWNLIILNRAHKAGIKGEPEFTDTYTVGDLPAEVYLIYEVMYS